MCLMNGFGDVVLPPTHDHPALQHPDANSARGGPTAGDALGEVWSIYYRQGFDEGYRRALKDLLGSLLSISERFIGEQAGEHAGPGPCTPSEARRVIYPFEEYLERQISRMTPDEGYVEGGMGI